MIKTIKEIIKTQKRINEKIDYILWVLNIERVKRLKNKR